jgi:hypothetical protein
MQTEGKFSAARWSSRSSWSLISMRIAPSTRRSASRRWKERSLSTPLGESSTS